jgi:transposase
MISFPTSARIVVAAKPVDFRRGGENLAALAREVLKEDPFSGADRVKIIAWDQTGLVMVWKSLAGANFRWPPIVDGCMRLSAAQGAALFEGLEWRRVYPQDHVAPTAAR